MKRTVFTLLAVSTLALVTSSSAFASEENVAPSHAQLAHRNADRQRTEQIAHSIGITRQQDARLQQVLRHQARDDQREHQASGGVTPGYRYSAPDYRAAPLPHNYSPPANGHSRPNLQYPAYGNGHAYPAYGRSSFGYSGLRISTPGFSFGLSF